MFVILGIGANLADPIAQLDRAVDLLTGYIEIESLSSVYVTEPVGYVAQPDFYNLVVAGTTTESVYGLHEKTQRIEASMGRTANVRNGPRLIDIDILAFGELVLMSPALTVPHPRMLERAFVLGPLAEVCPDWRHPSTGVTAVRALALLSAPGRVEKFGSLPRQGEVNGGAR